MGKRKVSEPEEDSAEYTSEENPKTKSRGKGKQKATSGIKKPTKKQLDSDSNSESESEEERPIAKKPKREVKGGVQVLKSKEGDKYVDLGKKKRATVRTFNKMLLLDIREFYEQAGEEKPGKKGISLTFEQWKDLKAAADAIDELFEELEAKRK